MRLAHLSDIHVAAESDYPPGDPLRDKARKHSEELLDRILADIASHEPDRVVLTGDLTLTSERAQFERARRHLNRFLPDVPVSVLPGNHDRWKSEAVDGRFFEASFGDLCRCDLGGAGFPYCHLDGGVALVALDSSPHVRGAEPSTVPGSVAPEQLARLSALARDGKVRGRFLVVLLHHHLRLSEEDAARDDPKDPTPLANAAEVERTLATLPVGLILHGHRHRQMRLDLDLGGRRVPVLCPGSATRVHEDPARTGRWALHRIEGGALVSTEVRAVDPRSGAIA